MHTKTWVHIIHGKIQWSVLCCSCPCQRCVSSRQHCSVVKYIVDLDGKELHFQTHCCLNLSLGLLPSFLNSMCFSIHSSFSTTTGPWALCHFPSTGSSRPGAWPASFRHGKLRLPDLCVPLHWCVGQLGIWGPGCRDGQESDGHRQHLEHEGDYAMPGGPPSLQSGEDEKPGSW